MSENNPRSVKEILALADHQADKFRLDNKLRYDALRLAAVKLAIGMNNPDSSIEKLSDKYAASKGGTVSDMVNELSTREAKILTVATEAVNLILLAIEGQQNDGTWSSAQYE